MGKYDIALCAMMAVIAAAMPAFAQDAPAAAEKKTPAASSTIAKPGGAVSSSYARCTPGQPIKGVIVKGGSNPTGKTAPESEGNCPATSEGEAAEGKGRTYTGGRRNDAAPAADAKLTTGTMPSRLSMTPTTAKTVAPAPATEKSISEKGVSSTRPR